ncbi:MAG: DUF4097 domain-containing protein [Lachnospiraceae bacterium]|nr:DUF4097 domain-containing protein [Lachnospiraceae bacterium]
MRRNKFLALILGIAIAAGLLGSAAIIFTGIRSQSTVSASRNSDQVKKSLEPYILEKTKLDEFSEISINLDEANLFLLPADGFYLEYRLSSLYLEPDYGVSNGKFHFREGSLQTSFHFLFGNPASRGPFYLNLYVPADQYFDLFHLHLESGNTELEQLNVKKADLSLSYGNLTLGSFTGDTLDISIDSGHTEWDSVTCKELKISASYGDITGDVLSVSNHADLNLDSGSLDLKNAKLENTDISSEYGNITLDLEDSCSDYNYDLKAEYGTIELDGTKIEPAEDDTVRYQTQNKKRKKMIQIRCDSGNIEIQ